MTLSAGRKLGRYEIRKQIGAGGMGEIYLAEDSRLRRKIALKVLPENIAQDKDRLRRFEQEAHSASALNHPNILTIYEFGADRLLVFRQPSGNRNANRLNRRLAVRQRKRQC